MKPEMRTHAPGFRVDDQQRSETVDQLASAVATGRLSADEFEERSELAFQARTSADLEVLLDDLHTTASVVSRPSARQVVTLTAADLAKVVAFAVVTGLVAWVVGGYAWPYQYAQRLLLWLFGLACGAAGAALRRRP